MKLSFVFNPAVDSARKLGEDLVRRHGGVGIDDADAVVAIGGDGSVLYALPRAAGKVVYGLVPPGSASVGFLCNRYDPDVDLKDAIAQGSLKLALHPLVSELAYAGGAKNSLITFSSLTIERDSGQAAVLNLKALFNGFCGESVRMVGDGVSFSTAMGSTALSYSHGGPVLPMHKPAFVMTPLGIGRPLGVNPVVGYEGDSFEVDCSVENGKRPLRIDNDGNSLRPDDPKNPFLHVVVSMSATPHATLALSRNQLMDPFHRVFMP